MVYTEYKEAAERHLEVCYTLSEILTDFEYQKQKRSVSDKEITTHDRLLADLYYLSGYMVECLYSYAMCKYENGRTGSISNNDVKATLDARNGSNPYIHTYRLCFTHGGRTNRTRQDLGVRYSITRERHQMSLSELSFFATENVANIQGIPLFDSSTVLSPPDIQKLFENWTAYERYKVNHFQNSNFPTFEYNTVVKLFWELVDTCSKFSKDILREITLFRKIIKKRPSNL